MKYAIDHLFELQNSCLHRICEDAAEAELFTRPDFDQSKHSRDRDTLLPRLIGEMSDNIGYIQEMSAAIARLQAKEPTPSAGIYIGAEGTRITNCHIGINIQADAGADMRQSADVAFHPPLLGLEQAVTLKLSGEAGTVIAITHHARRPTKYLVEYFNANGQQNEAWMDREALSAT